MRTGDDRFKDHDARNPLCLVLLVPRQMTLDHSGGVKEMTDEQLERGIELIKEMLAQREAGANAKVVEGLAEPAALPAPRKPRRKTRKSDTCTAARAALKTTSCHERPHAPARRRRARSHHLVDCLATALPECGVHFPDGVGVKRMTRTMDVAAKVSKFSSLSRRRSQKTCWAQRRCHRDFCSTLPAPCFRPGAWKCHAD